MTINYHSRLWTRTASVSLWILLATLVHGDPAKPPQAAWHRDDFLLIPLRVHLLSGQKATDFNTTLTTQDISRILKKMNGIWHQAGFHLYLESLRREEATHQDLQEAFRKNRQLGLLLRLRPPETQSDSMLHLYYVKELPVNGVYLGPAMFVKDTADLRPVPGGIDEPIPRVSSHEIGHAFGLRHRQARTNLMASGTTGTHLNQAEIDQVRQSALKKAWIETVADLEKRARKLISSQQPDSGERLLQHLQGLPEKHP